MASAEIDRILEAVAGGTPLPVYLVAGDLVVSEPQATRVAEAVAQKVGCTVETHRRPGRLDQLFADLRTFSLFGSAKVVLAIDTAILADSRAAADLIDQAADAPAVTEAGGELSGAQREAASRLLQALHVFGLDTETGTDAAELLDGLPTWAFQGGTALRKKKPRGRSKKDVATLRDELTTLLDAGRAAGLVGAAEGDLAELGELAEKAMPEGHCLVLAEASVAGNHPIVERLKSAGAFLETARVEADKRGNWHGLDSLVAELEHATGVGIAPAALRELAHRTLKSTGDFRDRSADAESTGRFAGEYRKLANLAQGAGARRIEKPLVADTIKDRGEEDVWKILDAIGEGRGGEALARYRRLVDGATDPVGQRLSFFSLLAGFCRQLSAVAGMARIARVPPNVRSYNTFKSQWAPKLQDAPPHGGDNPIAKLHPFRLHRAYLTASHIRRDELGKLPWRVLETELRIKGDASDPDAAVSALISHLVASRI
ncbi:MAG: hypothetical protein AAGE94_03200 [Acidobacteriota bacterium]